MNLTRTTIKLTLVFLALSFLHPASAENWPQAAGPNHDWTVTTDGAVPLSWSVEKNQNIRWRVPLPETGQSGIAVWGDRLFLTTTWDRLVKHGQSTLLVSATAGSSIER
jgi:hypothetical protein